MSELTHIDLFAGPGGICTGFKAAGINTILAIEYVDTCVETYRANHPEVTVLEEDIRMVTDEEIARHLIQQTGGDAVDIVSAGFPCETFSTAGSKSRVYDDHRNMLYQEAIRIADATNAKILMLENVPAFMSKKIAKDSNDKVLNLLLNDLLEAGFVNYSYDVLNAADYGVPQSRQRFILFASKHIPVSKTMFNGLKNINKVTVAEALSDLPPIGPEEESNEYLHAPENQYQRVMRSLSEWLPQKGTNKKLTYHIAPKHRPKTIERFKLIEQGEGLKGLFDRLGPSKVKKLQQEKILPKKWYIQRNQRLIPDKQSFTVTSHCLDEIVHPVLNRGLSVREAARLQSFPDWYDFKGGPLICPHIYKTQDKYEQIGDAVPPLLARHLGKSIVKVLAGHGKEEGERIELRHGVRA